MLSTYQKSVWAYSTLFTITEPVWANTAAKSSSPTLHLLFCPCPSAASLPGSHALEIKPDLCFKFSLNHINSLLSGSLQGHRSIFISNKGKKWHRGREKNSFGSTASLHYGIYNIISLKIYYLPWQ